MPTSLLAGQRALAHGWLPFSAVTCPMHAWDHGRALHGVHHPAEPWPEPTSSYSADWAETSKHPPLLPLFNVWALYLRKPKGKQSCGKAAWGYGNACFRNTTLKRYSGPYRSPSTAQRAKPCVCQPAHCSLPATGDYFPVIAVPGPLLHSALDINHVVNTSDQRVHSPFKCLINASFQCFLRNSAMFL